ncbi:MAG: hypothetical protein IT209_05480 [Armatimonadetes bacterium]|nr:hypothetical protein [Armatimonadota bacterium]
MAVNPTLDNSPKTFELADGPAEARHGVSARAVLIGFVAIIPGVFWGVYGDVVSQTDLTSTSLMMPPVLILTVLLLLNWLLKRLRPRLALAQHELITIYTMMTVAVILSGMGMIQFLCTTLGAVPYFKTPENEWARYLNDVPMYIMPKLSAIAGFYEGNQPVPWSAWWKPLMFWSGFIFAMLLTMTSINSILRKQWMDRERLTFPIVQLPLEMTEENSRFFRNRMMWAGFILAMALETLNSINFLYPQVPKVQIRAYDLQPFFTVAPWNAIGYFPTTFYPLAIGLGFVLSADVSFSCWFFYIVTKLENVFVAAAGWKAAAGSTPPFIGQQGTGAFIGIALSVLWLARKHLWDVFRKVFLNAKDVDDSDEPISYRGAVLTAIGGFAAMCGFCVAVGMSVMVAVAYLGVYLLFALTITRLRAVAGPPWTMGPDMNAMATIVQPIGPGLFTQRNLVALAYFNWFSVEMRCCPMPTTMEGMKMAQATRIRQHTMTIAMLIAIVAGIAVGFAACLFVWYHYGAGTAKVEPWRTGMGRAPFNAITGYIDNPESTGTGGVVAMVFAGVFTLVLGYVRTRAVWFPLHPAGYVLANTGTMYWLWCPFLIAWAAKVLITKYGGIKGYRTALPFFLGLVLGDFVTSSLWALTGSILGIRMYRCFPV